MIDLATRTVTATLDAKIFGANRLKFTPDGKLVLISSLRDGNLVIYDAASRKEFKRVPIGHGAAGILIDPDGSRAFIACSPDNYVAVVDLKTFEVTGHIDVGGEPDGLAWAITAVARMDANLRATRPFNRSWFASDRSVSFSSGAPDRSPESVCAR